MAHTHHDHTHEQRHAPPRFEGAFARSTTLLADAGHSLSDVPGLASAWLAAFLSRRHPSQRFAHGLRRSSILSAPGNAIFLLLVIGGIAWKAIMGGIAWEAIMRLVRPWRPIEDDLMQRTSKALSRQHGIGHATFQIEHGEDGPCPQAADGAV